ncbi:MAG: DMT family transporter [Rhodospirillales bacterium]|jgi:drug/metabolite transporter (DMT)-like permease|nr:DMT family transporter [Rhodospirillales bacterium]
MENECKQSPENKNSDENLGFGILMSLVAATAYGLITTLAKLAYDGGSNAVSVAGFRALFAIGIGICLSLALKKQWRISFEGYKDVFWVAIGQTGMGLCYMASIQYISVSLGAILFYTYPLIILIVEVLLKRELPGPIRILAFASAFIGLILAIGPSLESLDWRGIVFAFGAALSSTILFFSTRRARRHTNEIALLIWANIVGLPIIGVGSLFMGGFHMPETTLGWSGLIMASAMFALAFTTYSISMRHIAPVRASMFYNAEPLVSIIAACVILGEILSPVQISGATLVIAALVITAWRGQHQAQLSKSGAP